MSCNLSFHTESKNATIIEKQNILEVRVMQCRIWDQIDRYIVSDTSTNLNLQLILYIIIIKSGQFLIKLEQEAGAQSSPD